MAQFETTSCSQCGATFGPGDHGYSHCDDHTPLTAEFIVELIRNEYDKAPDYYKPSDNWDDGAERIAERILARSRIQQSAH